MPRSNFIGLSKSRNGTWNVHYQHHNPMLRLGIKSMPGKYFCIKQEDNGEIWIRYYDKILQIGFEGYEYSSVLKELFPDFNGNEIEADKFICDNQVRLSSAIEGSIYNYCIEKNKELKKFDIIKTGDKYIYYKISDNNTKELLEKYCELVKCTLDDLVSALHQYMQNISSLQSNVEINSTARARSIVHHYPGEK